jgi:hypothetical protein
MDCRVKPGNDAWMNVSGTLHLLSIANHQQNGSNMAG